MNIKTLFVKYIKLREKLDKAKIYKIIDNTNDNIYIGSTCKTLKERLIRHKCSYKSFLKGLNNNIKSFDILKNDDYHIELLENCNIKTKQELIARERFYIQNNVCLNKVVPGRTDKEYREDNKDKIKEYREANKDKKKDYYITNKDKIKQSSKDYYITNKDIIKDKQNQKIDCECGGKYTIRHKAQHFETTKHQEFIKSDN